MKVSCIDIGTNSIRLMNAIYENGVFSDVQKHLSMTRLGKGVNETRMLDEARMEESVQVIYEYCEMAKGWGSEEILLMATSAVRDALNSVAFVKRIADRTGFTIDVISGDLEAEVGFRGVLLGAEQVAMNHEAILVVDIGGGSTELIVGDRLGIRYAVSLNIGAVRLTGAYVSHDPVLDMETVALKSAAMDEISKVAAMLKGYSFQQVIGIGGTATTYATMVHGVDHYSRERVHGLTVDMDALEAFNALLASKTTEARKKIIGLEAKRADIIYAGGIILESVLKALERSRFSVSDYDNLEGYAAYKIEEKIGKNR
ncbi:MAG: Ppx/GppA family phosphatase [Firmicutes bacterium]|nr:Ppx/GppA family phosphatase [Bacillota bacterium]